VSFDAASRTFSGTPTVAGTYQVEVTATDLSGASVSDSFEIAVAPPALEPGMPIRIQAEDFERLGVFTVENVARASDGQVIKLGSSGVSRSGAASTDLADVGVTAGSYDIQIAYLDENDGQIPASLYVDGMKVGDWKFDAATTGNANQITNLRSVTFENVSIGANSVIELRASADGKELARIDYVELTPRDGTGEPANQAPVVADTIEDQSGKAGEAFSLVLPESTFTDADNDALTLTASGVPEGVSFDAASRTFSGTPTVAGTYQVEVTATDLSGASVSDSFEIVVGAAEPVRTVSVSAPAAVAEGAEYALTFALSRPALADQVVTYTVGGEAQPRNITIARGETEASVTLTAPQDQFHGQAPAPVTVAITGVTDGATIGTPQVSVTVEDDDLPEVRLVSSSAEVTEGGVATFNFTRTGDTSAPLTITVNMIGSATQGSDFTAPTTVAFAAGSGTAKLDVQTINDGVAEPSGETIEMVIAPGAGYTIGAEDGGVADLFDAPPAPVLPTLSITDASASEGGNANFRLRLSEPVDAPLTVTYQVTHGSTSTGDVATGTFTLNIARNVTDRGFNIATTEDLVFEPNETFTVKVLSVKTASGADAATIADGEATGTITNDDAAPASDPGVTLSKANLAVTEGGASDTFTVVLDAPPGADVTVQVSTGNELMALGPNGSSNLVFTAGNWNVPQTITVRSEDDGLVEGAHSDYVYFYTMSADANYDGLMLEEMMPVAITDAAVEAPMPYVTVANLGGDVTEGGEITFNLHRSEVGGDLPINWTQGGTVSADDIQAIKWNGAEGGVQGFKNGSQAATVTFVLKDDVVVESSEDITLTVENSPLYMYDDPFMATGTVLDNDTPVEEEPEPVVLPEISISAAAASVMEGDPATFTLTRAGSTTTALTVAYTLDGTATAGSDYAVPFGTVEFAAGSDTAIVTIQTTNDTAEEAAETVVLTLAPSANYTVTQASASSTISANDVPVVVPPSNQTITATTTAGVNFTGGEGNDTLVFPTIAAGGVQMLGGAGNTVVNAEISLGKAIVGTIYNGKTISNIENLTLHDIKGPAGRTLTVNGDAKDNAITVNLTTKKTDINGGDGADNIKYSGTGQDAQASVISGGTGNDTITVGSAAIIDDRVATGTSGDDTYDFGTGLGKQELRFGANNGNDIVKNYGVGDGTVLPDVLNFAAAGIQASNVIVTEASGNTVFTIDGTSTVTVEGVTGLQFGTSWTALGTYTPPSEEPPPGEDEPTGEPGINVSKFSLNLSEDGATDTTEVSLNSRPTSDVTITLGSDGGVLFSVNGAIPTVTPTLNFTPDNWNQPQTVTVTAVDDADYEPGAGTMIYFEPISTQDPLYKDVFPPSGWATIADNDAAPDVAPPEAQAMSADVWEDNPVVELQGNGYSASENGVVEYMIVSQPVEGGAVTMIDDRTFRFEGDTEFLSSLNRGETKAVTFEYAVSDGEVWSGPETMTFNVHGFTNGADEAYQAFTRSTPSQTDFLDLNGGDGNDTVVFNSITVTSGEDVSVGLDQAFHWTEYAGKSIINTENITIKNTAGDTNRTMTVSGNDQANVITIENTNHKLFINGLGGDDMFNFTGSASGEKSIITGGSGSDTVNANSGLFIDDRGNGTGISGDDLYNFGAGAQEVSFFGSNGKDTITGFTKGDAGDKLRFLAGAQDVEAAEVGTDTVFTTSTGMVTVQGVTGLIQGIDWMLS
jgi:hypothetical protein